MTRRVRASEMMPPRLLTERETAHLLGMCETDFHRRRADLEAAGLPHRHPLFHRRDAHAIHAWLDREFGLVPSGPAGTLDAGFLDRLGTVGGAKEWRG